MRSLLEQRPFPFTDVRFFASARSAGRRLPWGDDGIVVEDTDTADFTGLDLAIFSMGKAASRITAPKVAAAGAIVIDNSSAWRMDEAVPLVVSQVNPDDLEWHEGIVANPNCSTMQLVPVLMALRDAVGLRRVIVDTYQSVSGTGADALEELDEQVRSRISGDAVEARVYPHPIAFNALPEIDVFLPNGYTKEEWKVVTESRKILHLPDLAISCTAVRIPVEYAHSEAVHVETVEPITPDTARTLFAAVPGVVVRDDPANHVYPLALDAAGRDEIFVGRVRQDLSIEDGRGLALWVVSDNVRKGAATNAVELAELLVARDWMAARSRRLASAGGRTARVDGPSAASPPLRAAATAEVV
jgi:aspartate-semialdehyde dehydrogenase